VRKLKPPQALQPIAGFRIRRVGDEDLNSVLEVSRASFKHPWSPDLLRRELSHEWSTILLAEAGEPGVGRRPLGFLIYWIVHDELHILNIASHPLYRRRGVARAIMEAALEQAKAHRCVLATLEARRSNLAALSLYKNLGFRPVGVRPNYYAEEGEDAIVMVLDF
jgi:[ribosomal protein S18]-alanine N-acetyltransferase